MKLQFSAADCRAFTLLGAAEEEANGGILFMRYLADPNRVVMMDRWLMGGVDVLGYRPVLTLLIGVAPCGELDCYVFGDPALAAPAATTAATTHGIGFFIALLRPDPLARSPRR